MHLDKLIGTSTIRGIMRSYVDEPSGDASDWTNEELLDYVNMEHRHLFSVIRNLYEDWFSRQYIFPLVSGTMKYVLPREIVNPRRVEYINASAVTGTAPNYVVDENTADPQEIQEVQLSAKDNLRHYTSSNRVIRTNGFYLLDDVLQLLDDSVVGPQYYGRIYYAPTSMDLHRAVAQGATASTITLGVNQTPSTATTTLGYIYPTNNYYQGAYVEIISGTGEGQIRRIKEYNGSTKVATVEPDWTTTPTNASVYSIVSPIKEDFQEMLALGGVMRAKGIKIEDETSEIATIYTLLKDEMVNSLERRNNSQTRRVISTQRSGVWY